MNTPLLTLTTARQLLAPISASPVVDVKHISNTNDVFRVVTSAGGNFYVKFHTSPWYKAAPDTAVVVAREVLVANLLRRKGIPLDYTTWSDCTHGVVNRSVLITGELPGVPVPTALKEWPDERDLILAAVAQYLSHVHALTFPVAGYIEFCGDADLPPAPDPGAGDWWDSHPCQKPENLQRYALGILTDRAQHLPPPLHGALLNLFETIQSSVAPDYRPPHFVINNYHPFHIHVARGTAGWRVTGLYDFEAASSGSPTFDLVGNELQLAPMLGGLAWRDAFYAAYGRRPDVEAYRAMLLCFLLLSLGGAPNETVPDPAWLIRQMPALITGPRHEDLMWYPA
jgi:hypothetical protein